MYVRKYNETSVECKYLKLQVKSVTHLRLIRRVGRLGLGLGGGGPRLCGVALGLNDTLGGRATPRLALETPR